MNAIEICGKIKEWKPKKGSVLLSIPEIRIYLEYFLTNIRERNISVYFNSIHK